MRMVLVMIVVLASSQAWATGEKMPFQVDRIAPATVNGPPPNNFYVVRVCPGEKAPILRNVTLATDADFVAACAAAQQ